MKQRKTRLAVLLPSLAIAMGIHSAPGAAATCSKSASNDALFITGSCADPVLNKPYIDYIRQDLVNRWIYFDEDRNPNNYLVIQNSQRKDFLVAIDFDKADLTTTKMKITGDPDKFGWFRTEKTRFLTLLRPEHFQNQPLELFDARLEAFNRLSSEQLKDWAWSLLEGWAEPELAETLSHNLRDRIQYVNEYFRRWFKPAAETLSTTHEDDYSAFGKSFLQMYGDKR